MTAPLRALIDLDALRSNLENLAHRAGSRSVLAVVKADAYGHGYNYALEGFEAAAGLAVARLHEARLVRERRPDARIVVLGGPMSEDELKAMDHLGIEPVIHDRSQVEWLEQAPVRSQTWFKIDTGMHRLGFVPEAVDRMLKRVTAATDLPPVLMTHFARADEPDNEATTRQLAVFADVTAGRPGLRSVANSAGLLGWPECGGDWVRPGIALYGISPFAGQVGADHQLRPAMTLITRLIARRWVTAGEPIGYGGVSVTDEAMPVGVAAVGYADGYPRNQPPGTPVLVGGREVRTIGRVSMDLLTLDLREHPNAKVGDPVVLWGTDPEGNTLPVEAVASFRNTIPYELVSRVGARVIRQAR